MTNVTEFPHQIDEYIVSKEDDDLLKKWVMIGHHFFRDGEFFKQEEIAEIVIPTEACPTTVKLGDDGRLVVAQIVGNFEKVDEIDFQSYIDRTDAFRLAGLLVAWASDKKIHDLGYKLPEPPSEYLKHSEGE